MRIHCCGSGLNLGSDRQRLGRGRLGGRARGFLRWRDRLRRCGGLLIDAQSRGDIVVERGHDVAAGKAGRRLLDLIKALLEVGHFSLAHRFLELALEFGGHLARLGDPLPDHAEHAGQLLGADRNQRDHGDDEVLTPSDVEHESFRSREANVLRLGRSRFYSTGLAPAPPDRRRADWTMSRLDQTALLPTSDRAACGEALWSIDFTGSVLSTVFSSSCMPFLKALMPWATSPIRSEILPRPNSSRTTAITTIQCQMLNEPILRSSKHARPRGFSQTSV